MLATVVIWSANFVVAKAAVEALGPVTFTSLRYIVATATLFLLVRWRLGRSDRRDAWRLTLIGLGMLGSAGTELPVEHRADADHRRRFA